MKELKELYELGEKEGINFLNIKLSNNKGTLHRKQGVVLITISIKLTEKEEYIVLCHEMGHYYKDCSTELAVPISKLFPTPK